MNRILQADVILTLTREQAERIARLLDTAARVSRVPAYRREWVEVEAVVREQCAKQGVQL